MPVRRLPWRMLPIHLACDANRASPRLDSPAQVFFFIDKEILADPAMDHVNNITLSYTFFKTGDDGDEHPRLSK